VACGGNLDIPITLVSILDERLTIGESTIWVGAFMASAHALNSVPSVYPSWFGYAMVVSPVFITFLLTKVISHNQI